MNAITTVAPVHEPSFLGRPSALRIALFSGNYNYHMDGPVRALNRLVGYLERRGVPVMVFAPTSPTPACEPTGTLISIPSVAVPGRSEYRLGLGLPRYARRIIGAFRPTLFHIAAPDWSGYAALRYARRRNIPAVASFHTRFDTYLGYYGAAWLQDAATAWLRHVYGQCAQLYAPSESMAAVLRRQRMCGDVRIWGRGIDCAAFSPARRDMDWRRARGIADGDVVVAFVGRIVMEKGLEAFARALEALSAAGVPHRALVVGDGPALGWFRARLPDAVFAGFLGGEALARAYASSDIFFNPSTTETFGNVTAEAMASGLPAVCADATGSRSLVADGVTGSLVGPDAAGGFSGALSRLILDPALRARYGAAARERAGTLDWDRVLDGLFAHYLDALAQPAGRRAADAPVRASSEPVLQENPV